VSGGWLSNGRERERGGRGGEGLSMCERTIGFNKALSTSKQIKIRRVQTPKRVITEE
jgi:hypothetical protein